MISNDGVTLLSWAHFRNMHFNKARGKVAHSRLRWAGHTSDGGASWRAVPLKGDRGLQQAKALFAVPNGANAEPV